MSGTPENHGLARLGTLPGVLLLMLAAISIGAVGSYLLGNTTHVGHAFDSPLAITTTTLPTGMHGEPYRAQVDAAGGAGNRTFALHAGAFPEGVTLDGNTGVISGTPRSHGSFSVSILVTDTEQHSAKQTIVFAVNGPVEVATTELPDGYEGDEYFEPLTIIGGTGEYTVTVKGLPTGLSIDPYTFDLTGTPEEHGTFPVRIAAEDRAGHQGAATVRLVIAPRILIATETIPDGYVGEPYRVRFEAENAKDPALWAMKDTTLPDGLTLDPDTGVLSGTPTEPGEFPITITVVDATDHVATAKFILLVADNFTITSDLPDGIVGEEYTAELTTNSGIGNVRWSVSGLPDGLRLDPARDRIVGTPDTAGTFTVTLTATDRKGHTSTVTETFVIRTNAPSPSPSPTATTDPEPEPTPEPTSTSTPEPEPTPSPSPTATTDPEPEPSPSPTRTPDLLEDMFGGDGNPVTPN